MWPHCAVVAEHGKRRIDALERHVERRLKDLEAKLDEVLQRITSRAA